MRECNTITPAERACIHAVDAVSSSPGKLSDTRGRKGSDRECIGIYYLACVVDPYEKTIVCPGSESRGKIKGF